MTLGRMMPLRNRRAVPFRDVPDEPVPRFRAAVIDAVRAGLRIVSLFGMAEPAGGGTRLVAILADDEAGSLAAVTAPVSERYDALTPDCPQAARFEREIAEQCGIVPEGHPSLKPLRRHPHDHAAAEPVGNGSVDRDGYRFEAIEGESIHQVAVGPVHAGIIEPGHFRFHAHGERVLALEIMLGYQHRGVERLLETLDAGRAMLVAESIAGDTVIGHAGAYCGALEALARCRKTPRGQSIRGIALELERLANHLGDLGAIAGDVAFQPAASYFGRLRGECLNLLMMLSGNRYGRGLARPGGAAFDVPAELAARMLAHLERLAAELPAVGRLMLDDASVQSRLEGVGRLRREDCDHLGLVGPAARACEVTRDVRHDHPWGVFRFAHIPVATAWGGDVQARVLVRWLETQRSLEFVREQLAALPRGDAQVSLGSLRPGELVVAMAEGWRGEIAHIVISDGGGAISRYKVTDPSFHNWPALAAALPGQQISDFPLCNKSFNLSYAGHDL
jgi:Ni,Fe-hydrogenase III large subunit